MSISVDAIVGSTGLELKSDPGVPYVYAGFAGALCLCLRGFALSTYPTSTLHPACHAVPASYKSHRCAF